MQIAVEQGGGGGREAGDCRYLRREMRKFTVLFIEKNINYYHFSVVISREEGGLSQRICLAPASVLACMRKRCRLRPIQRSLALCSTQIAAAPAFISDFFVCLPIWHGTSTRPPVFLSLPLYPLSHIKAGDGEQLSGSLKRLHTCVLGIVVCLWTF